MAYHIKDSVDVGVNEINRVTYEERSALFGLITWKVRVNSESIGKDLIIYSSVEFDNIYLNGKKL